MEFTEFAIEQYPLLVGKFNMFNATKEELIGKKVFAIRSGFGCGSEGRLMIIDKIEVDGRIHLKDPRINPDNSRGWLSKMDNKHNDFIFMEDKKKLMSELELSNYNYINR